MRQLRTSFVCVFFCVALALPVWAAVDFTKYVAIGDSITAGYSSNGLAKAYQDHSYPMILARQFGVGASFQQPLVADPGMPPVLMLQSLAPTLQIVASGTTPGSPLNATLAGPYNNLGIPGATVQTVLTKTGDITRLLTGTYTPDTLMYDLILRDGKNPAVAQAIGKSPTFVTVWIGNNDVLNAVLAGFVKDGVTMTPKAAFELAYTQLLGTLKAQLPSATILVMNLPDSTYAPFVTTITPWQLSPTGQKFYLMGEDGPLQDGDFVTILGSPLISQGFGIPGSGKLLPEGKLGATGLVQGVILRASEIAEIRARITELNQVIASVAAANGAKLFDVNAFFTSLRTAGYPIGGIKLTPSFLSGGIFSYDGVHPQKLGAAVVATELIKFINASYAAKVPLPNLRPYLSADVALTSVAASNVQMSLATARELVRSLAPGLNTTWPGDHVLVQDELVMINEPEKPHKH